MGKLVCGWKRPPSCKLLSLLGFVPFPLSVEKVVQLGCIPQVWGDPCLALCLSLSCEVDILVALCLASKCRGGIWNWERSCVLPVVVTPNPRWRFPVWESCVDKVSGLEILLCEGGDVEQWLEPRNKLLVFAIDLLSLTLSLYFEHCIILPYHIYACVCVCLTCA